MRIGISTLNFLRRRAWEHATFIRLAGTYYNAVDEAGTRQWISSALRWGELRIFLPVFDWQAVFRVKLQYTTPWRRGERNPLVFWVYSYFGFVFWVCSYFGFVLVLLPSERSERSPRGNAEESYTAILPYLATDFEVAGASIHIE